MYYPSRYNHLISLKTKNGRNIRILSNLFFGGTDIINEDVYKIFSDSEKNGVFLKNSMCDEVFKRLEERGFVWSSPNAEEELVHSGADSYGQRDQIAAGLNGGYYGFITSLNCNLKCPYCFQRTKADSCGFLTPKLVDYGIMAIKNCEKKVMEINGGKETVPKIAITGGEPLLRNKANLRVIDYLMEQLSDLNWLYSITTNGTNLCEFIAEHELGENCRNIQVTLDGPREIHNSRRRFRNGDPSFDQIVRGVDFALKRGVIITLRVNLDMSNVWYMPDLAEFVKMKGWQEFENFLAYVSPVTDHGNLGDYETPKDEADLLNAVIKVIEQFPAVREVFDIRHFRGFNYVERILVQKKPRYPVIYRCEAVIGQYIFDPRGDVHVCLEAAGDPNLRVGTYFPHLKLNEKDVTRWTQRHVLRMEECKNCKVRFICAGGCTIDVINHNDTSRCMPFLREIDIAWQYFARNQPELFDL